MWCQLCQQHYPHDWHWQSCPKVWEHPALEAFRQTCDQLPGISNRLYNALFYIGRQQLCTVGSVTLTAMQALPDRELLRWPHVGRKTLEEFRRLTGDPDWDAWAGTLPQAWRQQRLERERTIARNIRW
jgi:hypothetical protein